MTEALALVDQRLRECEESITRLEGLRSDLASIAERGRRMDPADCDEERVCTLINPTGTSAHARPGEVDRARPA